MKIIENGELPVTQIKVIIIKKFITFIYGG